MASIAISRLEERAAAAGRLLSDGPAAHMQDSHMTAQQKVLLTYLWAARSDAQLDCGIGTTVAQCTEIDRLSGGEGVEICGDSLAVARAEAA
ncbi:hypothetical protein ACUXNS_000084 [Brevibacterium pityocampae]